MHTRSNLCRYPGAAPLRSRVLVGVFLVAVAGTADAEHDSPPPSTESSGGDAEQAPWIAIEIADRWIPGFGEQAFDLHVPVDLMVLGRRARGNSLASGHYTLHCLAAEDELAFAIRAHGTSTARTQSRNGPVVIHSTSDARFVATNRITLRNGHFLPGATSIDMLKLESIDSRVDVRSPVGRRLLQRLAHERMRRRREEIRYICRYHMARRVAAALDRSAERLFTAKNRNLHRLNRLLTWLVRTWNFSSIDLQTSDGFFRLVFYANGVQDQSRIMTVIDAPQNGLRVIIDRSILPGAMTQLLAWQF